MVKSVKLKILGAILIPVIIVSLVFSLVLFYVSNTLIDDYIEPEFKDNLTLTVDQITNYFKADDINEAIQNENKRIELLALLRKLLEKYELEYAYIQVLVDGEEYSLISSETDDTMDPYPFTEDERSALKNPSNIILTDIYTDDYGTHLSANKAIEGTNAVIGIDIDASFIKELNTILLWSCLALSMIFIVFAAVVAIVMARKITNPLRHMVDYTQFVSHGDLTRQVHITTNDELATLGESFNQMQHQLRQTIVDVKETTNTVNTGAQEMSVSMNTLADNSVQVAHVVQEIAANSEMVASGAMQNKIAVEDITHTIVDIAETTEQIENNMKTAYGHAVAGNEKIQQSVRGIATIQQTAKASLVITEQMDTRSNEVGQITQVITSISEQINLLALNAAIEAARAGEYGKGFAVVADEVRKLAEKSKVSAENISSLITSIQGDSTASVHAITKVVEEVDGEIINIQAAGEVFQTITHLIETISKQVVRMTAEVQMISAGSQEVLATTNETVHAISTTASNTQMIASSVQELTASLQELLSITLSLQQAANNLDKSVNHFTI